MDWKQGYMYSSVRADMDRLEKISRVKCKPGYTYNETIDKCLAGNPYAMGAAAIKGEMGKRMGKMANKPQKSAQKPANPPKSANPANNAIANEAAMRQSQGLK